MKKFIVNYNHLVIRLRQTIPAFAVIFMLCAAGFAQNHSLSEPEKESYEVWAAALRIKDPRPAWTVVQQTWPFKLCLENTKDQAATYGPMFDDYSARNKNAFTLDDSRFQLPRYMMVPIEVWTKGPTPANTSVVSAVGFNREKTRATVCLWSNHSGTCEVLIRKDNFWQHDLDWHGNGCVWAA